MCSKMFFIFLISDKNMFLTFFYSHINVFTAWTERPTVCWDHLSFLPSAGREVSSSSHYCELRGESLVWLIGAAMMCLLAAPRVQHSLARATNGDIIRCGTTGSCQSAATLILRLYSVAGHESDSRKRHINKCPDIYFFLHLLKYKSQRTDKRTDERMSKMHNASSQWEGDILVHNRPWRYKMALLIQPFLIYGK